VVREQGVDTHDLAGASVGESNDAAFVHDLVNVA
jgi:hypothetical protein